MSEDRLHRHRLAGIITGVLVAVPLAVWIGWWAMLLAPVLVAEFMVRTAIEAVRA